MNKAIRVLQLIDSLQVGGAEMMAVNIANALSKNGFESYLAVSRKEGPLQEQLHSTVGYFFLNRTKRIDLIAFYKLYQYLKIHKITIIHAHATSWFLAVVMKWMRPSLKIVWHDHFGNSEKLQQRNTVSLKVASLFFKVIIAVNHQLLQWATNTLYTNKRFYMPNFVSSRTVENQAEVLKLKGENGKRIICLANFRPQKDHINVLQAFEMVHQEYPDWTLHLVGNTSDEAYFKTVEDFIGQNQLTHQVFIYENCHQGASLLFQAAIGVLSSESEGLPLALLEYGMAKLAVVVTAVGECSAVVENGINGLVVPPKNSTAFAEPLRLLMVDPKRRNKLGENLFLKVQASYSEQVVMNQLIKYYQDIA